MAMALAQPQDHPHHHSLCRQGSHGRLLRIPGPIHGVEQLCELVFHFDQAFLGGQTCMLWGNVERTVPQSFASESRFEDFLKGRQYVHNWVINLKWKFPINQKMHSKFHYRGWCQSHTPAWCWNHHFQLQTPASNRSQNTWSFQSGCLPNMWTLMQPNGTDSTRSTRSLQDVDGSSSAPRQNFVEFVGRGANMFWQICD